MKLKIFKENALLELNEFVQTEEFNSIELSKNNKWALNYFSDEAESNYLFESKIATNLEEPLKYSVDEDFENAILLYENLKLTNIQAVDERLWSYLALVEFWDYTYERWIKGKKNQQVILERGILKISEQSDRRFMRNSISRLWWGVHTTICNEEKDKYELTKTLFSYQDVYQQTLERSYSKNSNITKVILKCINVMKEKEIFSRRNYRVLLKEVTRLSGIIVIDTLSQNELFNLLMQSEELNKMFI
ncbi:hypothetical protein BEN65_14300 [Listeria monocytogenes]|nr:hypothetical protein [Listeria monocytogenes]